VHLIVQYPRAKSIVDCEACVRGYLSLYSKSYCSTARLWLSQFVALAFG